MKRSINFLVIILMSFSIILSTLIYISAENAFEEIIDVSITNDLQNYNYLCSSSFSWEAMSSQFSRSLLYNLVGATGEIHTTDGTEIQNVFKCSSDYTQSQAAIARNAYMEEHYPYITEAYQDSGLATASYNCHAFAWYGAPYNGSYWIDYPTEFIDDIHCREITDLTELQEDDIIVFYDGNLAIHSAKIYNIYFEAMSDTPTIECISKCGPQGVYIHSFEYTMQMYPYTHCSYYRYEQDQHDLKLKEDNGEDGCIVKCQYCDYTIYCDEAPEYLDIGDYGHHASCPGGCFSFVENHTFDYSPQSVTYHIGICIYCMYYVPEIPHTWVATETGYICSDCGRSITYNLANGISNLFDEELSVLLTLLSESERNALVSSLSSDTDISRITIAIDIVNTKNSMK